MMSPQTLGGLLARAADTHGDDPAFLDAAGGTTGFAELELRAKAVGRVLKDVGAAGSLVQIDVADGPEFAAAFYGVALAGCTAVLCPLPSSEKPPYKLDTQEVRAMVSGGPYDGRRLRQAGQATLEMGGWEPGMPRVACIMGSSGTLGRPKAVMLAETGLVANALAGLAGYPYPNGTRIVHLVPYTHGFGLTCGLNAALAAGATIAVPEHPAAFMARLERFAPTALNLPPRAARMLLEAMDAAPNPALITGGALDKILCGGAALEVKVARGLERHGVAVHGCYGLTECSPCVSVSAGGPFEPGGCGRPLACNAVGALGNGELWVSGANVMVGYYGDPELTALSLVDGVFHTGDRGFVDERGCVHVEGRLDTALALDDGRLLSPEVVEQQLCVCPAIDEALVTMDVQGALVAILYGACGELRPDGDDYARGLRFEGGRSLDCVVWSEVPLPRTALGKVVRSR